MIPKVNIYIETTFENMSQHAGSAMYVVEFIKTNGAPETREGFIGWQQGKELRLILKAAAAALSRLITPCEVTIYTTYRLMKTAIDQEWLDAWRQQGWKKTNGAPLQHAEEWKAFGEAAEKHLLFAEIVSIHSYKEWMQREMQQKDSS